MIPHGVEVFVGLEPIDLRWGFDRLSGIVAERLTRDARSGALFVFFGKRRDALKVLFFDGPGLCMFYKRLDRGAFRLPLAPEEIAELQLELREPVHVARLGDRARAEVAERMRLRELRARQPERLEAREVERTHERGRSIAAERVVVMERQVGQPGELGRAGEQLRRVAPETVGVELERGHHADQRIGERASQRPRVRLDPAQPQRAHRLRTCEPLPHLGEPRGRHDHLIDKAYPLHERRLAA